MSDEKIQRYWYNGDSMMMDDEGQWVRYEDLLLRTCGACAQWKPAGKRHLCERFRCFTDGDDGCVKGWRQRA